MTLTILSILLLDQVKSRNWYKADSYAESVTQSGASSLCKNASNDNHLDKSYLASAHLQQDFEYINEKCQEAVT